MLKKTAKNSQGIKVEKTQMLSYCDYLFEHQRKRHNKSSLYGLSSCVNNLVDHKIEECAAASGSNILVIGRTGTGKELVINEIKRLSEITDDKFVAINCAEFPEDLLASDLFGHKKGAFTGATENRDGLLKTHDGGALFLDELGAMPQDMQAQILRVIEYKEYRPVGSDKIEKLKKGIRFFAATNSAENVREDLKWRFQERISIPPLRLRPSDVFAIMQGLLDDNKGRNEVKPTAQWAITADNLVRTFFSLWPGNVRELKNAVDVSIARWKFDKSKTDYILFQYDPGLESGEMLQDSWAIQNIWKKLVERVNRILKDKDWESLRDYRKLFSAKRLTEMTERFDHLGWNMGLSKLPRVDRVLFYRGKKPPSHKPFFSCAEAITFLCLTDDYLTMELNGGWIYTKRASARMTTWTDFYNRESALSLEFLNPGMHISLPDVVSDKYDRWSLHRKESITPETPDLTGYKERELLELYYRQLLDKYPSQKDAAEAAGIGKNSIAIRKANYVNGSNKSRKWDTKS